jgi:hypothetical protein
MNVYQSEFWQTESWFLRSWAMFDTYKAVFFLNNDNDIIWFKSDDINNWKLFWNNSNIETTKLWVWNIVKYIIEEEKFKSIEEFLKEINIAYSYRLKNILDDDSKEQKI